MAETQVESVRSPQDLAKKWTTELQLAENEDKHKKWLERSKKVIDRYRDERGTTGDNSMRMNVLWSNIQTLRPAVYAKSPQVVVERRYKDRDTLGRIAATILERCTSYCLQSYNFDQVMLSCTDDYLLPGRGAAWAKLTADQYQGVECEYVYWKDLLHRPSRSWAELKKDGWIRRRAHMTREQLVERFKEKGKEVKLKTPEAIGEDNPIKSEFQKGQVDEIWDAATKTVIWLGDGLDVPLDVKEDWLHLRDFYPCPRPLYATLTNDSLIPIPDYYEYQDQALEIDNLTDRINGLTGILRAVGVYDASAENLANLLSSKNKDGTMLPVQSWAAYAGKGGLDKSVEFVPIKEIAEVLVRLYEARARVIEDMYQVTGISDIVRGQTKANETATAQQIKGNFATLRLQERQKEVQRFARDLIRIKAELIAEHFTPETMMQMSGIQLAEPELQQVFGQAVQLLRDDKMRSYRVDIETDSTIALDMQQEKQDRIEFLTAMGQFMQQAVEVGTQVPQLLPLFGEAILFGVRGFRTGRRMETAFEEAVDQIKQQANQPPPPSPEQQKAEADMQAQKQDMELRQQEAQQDAAIKQGAAQQDSAIKTQEANQKAALHALDMKFRAEEANLDLAIQAQKAQQDRVQSAEKARQDRINAQRKANAA